MTAMTSRPADVDAHPPVVSPVGRDAVSAGMSAVGEAVSSLPDWLIDRLVVPRPDCLLWTGACDRGYGRVFVDGTAKRVHRVVWEHLNGPVPDGLEIDHVCRVRACVNPDHLELVTHQENLRRAAPYRIFSSLARKDATECVNGHPYMPDRPYGTRDRCLECRRGRARRHRLAANPQT